MNTEVEICVDCLVYEANGETGEMTETEAADFKARFNAGVGDALLALGDGDGSFSWTACDVCGSTLGGDRYDATLIRRQ